MRSAVSLASFAAVWPTCFSFDHEDLLGMPDELGSMQQAEPFLFNCLFQNFDQQSSSPPASAQPRDDEAIHGENGIDATKREPTHKQRTTAVLEQEMKEYEKKVKELEREVTILQLKVHELEAKDTSHLACRVEAQWLRRDKEAAEALAASYKDQLALANELIIARTPSQGPGKKRRSEGAEEGSSSKRQKP